jgi:hypothetical protein
MNACGTTAGLPCLSPAWTSAGLVAAVERAQDAEHPPPLEVQEARSRTLVSEATAKATASEKVRNKRTERRGRRMEPPHERAAQVIPAA